MEIAPVHFQRAIDENVAVNRGMDIKTFAEYEKARNWLLEDKSTIRHVDTQCSDDPRACCTVVAVV
jgi:hypothetical protein